jgi:hypothetical protein
MISGDYIYGYISIIILTFKIEMLCTDENVVDLSEVAVAKNARLRVNIPQIQIL